MKIIHIIIGLGIGGAELMLKRLVEGLNDKDGMQHSIISLTELGPVGKQLQEAGISVKALGMKNAFNFPEIFFKLRRELKRKNPDIVQTWMYHADFLGGLAAKSLGIHNVIWSVRNTHLNSGGRFNLFFRRFCSYISHKIPKEIIYVSHSAQKEHVKENYRNDIGRVIGNGFDTNKYSFNSGSREKYRAELGLKESDITVFSIGRYVPAKDHTTFVKAICLAAKENPQIKGVLVGRDISIGFFELSDLEKKHFILLGERSDISELLSAADIFCLHSITEGFPNVLGEAMSVGLPCIATAAGDAALILNDKDYVVNVRDFFSIATKINELARQPVRFRNAIGDRNRNNIKDNYSIEKKLKKYFDLYKELKCNS